MDTPMTDLPVVETPSRGPAVGMERMRRLIVAAVAAALGLVALVAGWVGTSGTRVVSDQLSYIASGGMLGLFLVAVACAVLLWDAMVEQQQANAELRDRLWRIEFTLGTAGPRPDGADREARASVIIGDEFVALPGAERVHRTGCPLVRGKTGARIVSGDDVVAAGLKPCRTCAPQLAGAAVH